MNVEQIVSLVGTATLQTLSMVFFSTIFSLVLGLPLGILLCVTDPVSGIMPKPILNQILTRIVNVLRSFPFIILMILKALMLVMFCLRVIILTNNGN